MSDVLLKRALAALVPDGHERGDWLDVLRRAGSASHGRRLRRPGVIVALAAVALLAVTGALIAAVRTNIIFSQAKPAPNVVKKHFLDLTIGAPPVFGIQPLAREAREVGTFDVGRKTVALWVVPNRQGGFCYQFEGRFGGCRPADGHGIVGPLSLTWTGSPIVQELGGVVVGARASAIRVDYRDGAHETVSLVYVSKPIDAAFFIFAVPAQHLTSSASVTAVSAVDSEGHELDRNRIPPQHEAPPYRANPNPAPPTVPRVPPPTPPLQHGIADGVSVVVGANGVVVFDTRNLNPHARSLMRYRRASWSYGCFRLAREFGIYAPRALDISGPQGESVRLQFDGIGTPFDGCGMPGSWGHRWPDRNGGHAPVEIPLTPAGHRFFVDRAAARDLGLFVRSPAVRRIRAESGGLLERRLSRYPVTRLDSIDAPIAASRIGYVPAAQGVTFVERSPTGRRFSVRVVEGKIRQSNLEPYAWAF
jgi:hypothetical protein